MAANGNIIVVNEEIVTANDIEILHFIFCINKLAGIDDIKTPQKELLKTTPDVSSFQFNFYYIYFRYIKKFIFLRWANKEFLSLIN